MPISGRLCLVLCLTSLLLVGRSQTPAPPRLDSGQADQTEKTLAAARQALGGDAKLTAVKTFVTTGRTRQVRGENLVPIEFEILCELPDKYLRKDEVPAQESGPTSLGFNGDSLIQLPVPTPPPAPSEPARAGGRPAPNPAQLEAARKSRAMTVKQDFARLTLGMFAASFSSFPLTFSYGGQAEAPQGKADVLNVKGPGTFNVRYLINSTTHLPVMLIWQMPPSSVIVSAPGQPPPSTRAPGAVVVEGPAPPPATASQEERDKYMKDVAELRKKAQAKLVEHRLYYADYRDTDGLMFPFRIRRAIGADTTEETVFDRFRINVKIDPRRFEVSK